MDNWLKATCILNKQISFAIDSDGQIGATTARELECCNDAIPKEHLKRTE